MAEVELSCTDGVATLVLNRASHRNAMSAGLVAEMTAAIASLSHDPAIGAIVLRGDGKGFCAGSDVAGLAAMDDPARRMFEADSGRLARMIGQSCKPVVAAVHGFAIGGGLTLAAACDVVIATPDSKWSLPEVPIGLFPAWGLEAIVRRVGVPKARQLAWGLDILDGTAASEWGLADLVADDPVSTANALARRLGDLPGEQREAVKAYFAAYASVEAADIRANDLFMTATKSPEAEATFERFRSGR